VFAKCRYGNGLHGRTPDVRPATSSRHTKAAALAVPPLPAQDSRPTTQYVGAVVGDYRDLFTATAAAAGTLTGLLFVALSVALRPEPGSATGVIHQVRVAAALLAFTNALAVSLFSLVPGTNVGYPAAALGATGIFFIAAGIRSIWSSHATRRQQLRQLELINLLLLIFGVELASGIIAIEGRGGSTPLELIGYTLVASLLVGIARAWELVGDRNTGIVASLAVLTGHTPAAPNRGEPGQSDDGHDDRDEQGQP
jgi:hypothetical protein